MEGRRQEEAGPFDTRVQVSRSEGRCRGTEGRAGTPGHEALPPRIDPWKRVSTRPHSDGRRRFLPHLSGGMHVLEGEKSEKAGSWLSGGGERGEGLGVVVPAERCSRRTPA